MMISNVHLLKDKIDRIHSKVSYRMIHFNVLSANGIPGTFHKDMT